MQHSQSQWNANADSFVYLVFTLLAVSVWCTNLSVRQQQEVKNQEQRIDANIKMKSVQPRRSCIKIINNYQHEHDQQK